MNRREVVTSSLLLLSLFAPGGHGNAWELNAHRIITQHALDVLPGPLKRILEAEVGSLQFGVVEPDYNRVDDHKLRLSAIRGTMSGLGGASFALERFAHKAEAAIKAEEPVKEIAFVLGQAAHFIQDLNVPLHTIWGETREEHATYERQAYFLRWPGDRYGFRGFYLVKSYKCFAYETAQRSHPYVTQALSPVPASRVIEETWDGAVNDTANLWISIFYRALGPEKSLERYGIPTPKGEKGKGWFC